MSRTTKILLSVAAIVAVVVGGGVWWFLQDDAPDEVSLDAAIDGVTSTTDTGSSSTEVESGDAADDVADTDGVAGTWTVDTESGEFDYESASGTFVGFRIEEELSSIGSTTAVGRTGDVSGTMVIDGTTVTEATFDIDLTTITTNESRRDDNVQSALETDEFPTATFTLTEPIELGAGAADGEAVAATAVGTMTLHGVTQDVSFELEAQLVDSTVVVVGSTEVTFSDYDVDVPSSPVVVSVEDSGVLELQLLLVQGGVG